MRPQFNVRNAQSGGKEGSQDSRVRINGDREFDELSREEERRLANAIVLRVLSMNSYPGVVEDFTGKKFFLKSELVIFADMGSGYPDVISSIDADVIVVDHHFPVGRIEARREFAHINPHLAGIDGSYELSASGTAFIFANEVGDNSDLSSLALLGMIGDKQKISGGNAEIVKKGVESGHIDEREGLRMISGSVRDVLRLSLEPYLDFYSKEDELEEFLERVRINGDREFDELSR
ncbi:MAG: DHH family phosphoesterase, partial [Archaeoglobi archaeon]|nr:DHH family phosphoesterase [Archaeoglobi archaeon]